VRLCLDVGNSQIYGGLYNANELKFTFRKSSTSTSSSDEYGLFLKSIVRENGIEPSGIHSIGIATVVPQLLHSLRGACLKYFGIEPFIFGAGVKTGLRIKYHNPIEVGSDRIANAVAAVKRYPGSDLIIIDFGTATTFCAVTKDKDYLGGVITAGVRISMEALEAKTAKLPSVEIVSPVSVVGRSTAQSIQSGLYWSHVGMMKEIITRIQSECFNGHSTKVLATGGFARLFEAERLFDVVLPNLVLEGLSHAIEMNQG